MFGFCTVVYMVFELTKFLCGIQVNCFIGNCVFCARSVLVDIDDAVAKSVFYAVAKSVFYAVAKDGFL